MFIKVPGIVAISFRSGDYLIAEAALQLGKRPGQINLRTLGPFRVRLEQTSGGLLANADNRPEQKYSLVTARGKREALLYGGPLLPRDWSAKGRTEAGRIRKP